MPALGRSFIHLCVDMQRLFAEDTPWRTPWLPRVLPVVRRITDAHAERTIFTRFIPAERPGDGSGTWQSYYERWADMTLQRLPRALIELVPELACYAPPALVLDKNIYSPWLMPDLDAALKARAADTLVITGLETDVCVLATVLGAVDRGYRVVVVTDGICSSSDETHDAMLHLYSVRYTGHIQTATAHELLQAWT
jgi:nicotinamidase-related amidase